MYNIILLYNAMNACVIQGGMILKGQCHEIFDLYIFSLIEPIWAPDKQAEMVFLKDSFSRRYSNFWQMAKNLVTLPL